MWRISALLADSGGLTPEGMVTAGEIFRSVLFILIVLCAIAIVVTVLLQSNNDEEGMESIMGSQESYYAQNKGSSRDGKLKLITIITSVIIIVCTLVYFLSFLFFPYM